MVANKIKEGFMSEIGLSVIATPPNFLVEGKPYDVLQLRLQLTDEQIQHGTEERDVKVGIQI